MIPLSSLIFLVSLALSAPTEPERSAYAPTPSAAPALAVPRLKHPYTGHFPHFSARNQLPIGVTTRTSSPQHQRYFDLHSSASTRWNYPRSAAEVSR